jgi:hypothetical protein
MARINAKCTINPEAWVGSTQKEFLERFKGYNSPENLKAIHKEIKKLKK